MTDKNNNDIQLIITNLPDDKKEEKKDTTKENIKDTAKEKVKEIVKKSKKRKSSIDSIDSLLEEMHKRKKKKTTSRYEKGILYKLAPTLSKLNRMVGMNKLKKNIINQVLYYIQGLNGYNDGMMHTVIEGSPGTGKTDVARIIGEIYRKLDFLSNDGFRVAKRDDFVAGYLGQTAIKTQKLLEECYGGVLFIDEAYSLGNPEGRDSFAKEALDTLNQFLSENKNNFVCIIAGYKDSLEKSFFNMNEGLKRRFPWKYNIESYTSKELQKIFLKQIFEDYWEIDCEKNKLDEIFEENCKYLSFNGGDTENLFQKCKIAHSHRIFCTEESYDKRTLNIDDIENGFELHKDTYPKDRIDNFDALGAMYV